MGVAVPERLHPRSTSASASAGSLRSARATTARRPSASTAPATARASEGDDQRPLRTTRKQRAALPAPGFDTRSPGVRSYGTSRVAAPRRLPFLLRESVSKVRVKTNPSETSPCAVFWLISAVSPSTLKGMGINPARGAWLSEMLCHYHPTKYPILNRPVRAWLVANHWRTRRGSTEGQRYTQLAQQLRLALHERPAGARTLAELDAAIWQWVQDRLQPA